MNIKQLEYFIGAAKSASLNEAAARVFITQPALSASLATLESEMGVTLFSKQKNKKSILNPLKPQTGNVEKRCGIFLQTAFHSLSD